MGTIQPLWQPSDERIRRSAMYDFMQRCAARFGFPADSAHLHAWSVRASDAFWEALREYAGIRFTCQPSAPRIGQGMLGTRWFPGAELNIVAHLLRPAVWSAAGRPTSDAVAIAAEDERGRTRSLSYAELCAAVVRVRAGLVAAGVGRGDRVGGYLSNIPETVIAMLAAASLGAIWSSCSPDFGADAVVDRLGQIEPRVLFTVDGYTYNGKPVDCRDKLRSILARIPSIQRVVVVPFLEERPDLSSIRNATTWDAFCAHAQSAIQAPQSPIPVPDPAHRPPITDDGPVPCAPVPFDHPLYILYSSGTTGVPKCIVHGHGGTLLQHMKELMLHSDLRAGDVLFYFTTCGWMMWNWLVSGLGVGATIALYEGSPSHPDLHHLWRFAERVGVTHFGTSPRFIAACQKAALAPDREHRLDALRVVLSTGSPLTPDQFAWVYDHVKRDVQLASISGGTDIISCFMLGNPTLPVYAGEIQCIGLGMDVHAFDDHARPVIGQKGELVCCSPFPSQPVCFWNDPDGEKYRRAYFDVYAGVWRHGDFVEITPRGGVIVYGRSDATLNPGGVRIGTAEIYREVEAIPEIVDSVVVGKNTPDADVEVCLFVVLREGLTLDDALAARIRQRIAEGASKRHVPKHIKQVTAIPYTRSGKKVEIAVTRVLHGEPVPNREALANPEALEQFAGIV